MTEAAAGEGLDFHLDALAALQHLRRAPADPPRRRPRAPGRGQGAAHAGLLHRGRAGRRRRRRWSGSPPRSAWTAAEVEQVLAGDGYADAVRADEAEARALGISGVPFFVVDRKYGVSGAQPADQLLAVLERAWCER